MARRRSSGRPPVRRSQRRCAEPNPSSHPAQLRFGLPCRRFLWPSSVREHTTAEPPGPMVFARSALGRWTAPLKSLGSSGGRSEVAPLEAERLAHPSSGTIPVGPAQPKRARLFDRPSLARADTVALRRKRLRLCEKPQTLVDHLLTTHPPAVRPWCDGSLQADALAAGNWGAGCNPYAAGP